MINDNKMNNENNVKKIKDNNYRKMASHSIRTKKNNNTSIGTKLTTINQQQSTSEYTKTTSLNPLPTKSKPCFRSITEQLLKHNKTIDRLWIQGKLLQ